MPNYVHNTFVASGLDADEQTRLENAFKSGAPFHQFIACPPYDTFNVNGHECVQSWVMHWRIENWGVKWEPSSIQAHQMSEEGNQAILVFTFNTAWNPPVKALKAISECFPKASFRLSCVDEDGDEAVQFDIANGSILD